MNASALPLPANSSGRTTAVAGVPPLRDIVAAARELVPYLAGQAAQTERDRRVSDHTTQLFHQAGFFRLMQPASFGGYEYGFSAFIDVISELGRGCTSSAWSCSLGAIHQWLIGTFPQQAQVDVWDGNPEAIICGSYAPVTLAEAAHGGWLIHGKWQFASNVDNSQWAMLGAQFPAAEKGAPAVGGFLLVPRSEWSIEDDWHVAGQAGTGSKTVVIDKPTFVPGHRRLLVSEAASGSPPGAAFNRNPLYRIPFISAVPVTLISPLLGTAQGAVDAFIDLCGTRLTRGGVGGGGNRLSQFFPVQSRLAEAAAAVDAARLLIYRDIAEVEELVGRGEVLSVEKRIRNRRDHAYATRLALSAVEAVFACVGAMDSPWINLSRECGGIRTPWRGTSR